MVLKRTKDLFNRIVTPGEEMATFRKSDPPALGPAFDIGQRNPELFELPGGAMLAFDLSKLTLADYRVMRSHPQINASLSLMTFMIHQMDWKIVCEDKKIAGVVEDNLRLVWTRLIRATSMAFWAGYAPCALEWENEPSGRWIYLSKILDIPPEYAEVNWKEVPSSYIPPNRPNQTVPKVNIFDGIKKTGLNYPIPPEHAFWYPLLMESNNYYGRKLLKPAFMPWYFSMLIHLYANRYFERFGEPVPVGRAPFDEDFVIRDADDKEVKITGKQAMENILLTLRNRGIVVLPSDRDPTATSSGGRSEYLYDIEYLESQMRGADFERYLSRLDEEISLSIFTPMLLMRTGAVGSLNLGVQHTQCVAPETPILCADLVWRPAGELVAGQKIIAFDEDGDMGQGRGVNARCYRTAEIVGNVPSQKPSMRLTTDIGDPITASVDHPWLVWRNRKMSDSGCRTKGLVWVETRDLVVGDQIAHFARPWEREESFDAGWLSGMFDGEGCLCRNWENGNAVEISLSQIDGPVMDKAKRLLGEFGVQASITGAGHNSMGTQPQSRLRIGGGFFGAMEFVGRFASERFIAKASDMWEDRGVRRNQSYELATVTFIEDVGMNPVASIQTSTGTFITGGYLSHNTWLWSLNALVNDMKEYFDRYIIQRIKGFNFTPNAPRCEIVFRDMGKDNPDTLRAIITQLISGGTASVDLEELGVALGMTVKEVKQVLQQPVQQGTDVRPRDERNRSVNGPRQVGEPLRTTKQIAARVGDQVKKMWGEPELDPDFKASLGHRRRMIEAFVSEGADMRWAEDNTDAIYANAERFSTLLASLGKDEFSSPEDFVSMIEHRLIQEIEALVPA